MRSPGRQHIKLALSELTLAIAAIIHAACPAPRHPDWLASSPSAVLQASLAHSDKQPPK